VTDDSAFKKQVRARMAETGENYTTARRMVIAARDPGHPPVALRVYLNSHVDLELTDETARAYRSADEQGQRDMANRLLADHIEMAGSAEAGAAAGSEILTVQELRIDEIGDAIHRLIPRAAGVATIAVSDDLDYVRVGIQAARPCVVHGHGDAELNRLRAELEDLIGKPVQLNMMQYDGPPKGRKEVEIRHQAPGSNLGLLSYRDTVQDLQTAWYLCSTTFNSRSIAGVSRIK
jgi:hypothetical protein